MHYLWEAALQSSATAIIATTESDRAKVDECGFPFRRKEGSRPLVGKVSVAMYQTRERSHGGRGTLATLSLSLGAENNSSNEGGMVIKEDD